MMEAIRVEATVKTQPARFSMPCWVEVILTNQSSAPVLINGRLSVGYRNSINRELFAEVFRRGTDDVTSKDARLYQRDPPQQQDYVSLDPGKSISTTLDLFKWYDLPGPGDYDLVVSYSGDEFLRNQPEDSLAGIYSSDRVPLDVIP
jgi:hypothetical protein